MNYLPLFPLLVILSGVEGKEGMVIYVSLRLCLNNYTQVNSYRPDYYENSYIK